MWRAGRLTTNVTGLTRARSTTTTRTQRLRSHKAYARSPEKTAVKGPYDIMRSRTDVARRTSRGSEDRDKTKDPSFSDNFAASDICEQTPLYAERSLVSLTPAGINISRKSVLRFLREDGTYL